MAADMGNGANPGRGANRSTPETANVASEFRETPGNVCRLGGAMIRDLGRGQIGHKEVTSYARAAGVVLGGARVGAQVGFNRDLNGTDEPDADKCDDLRQREEELTAELEAIRERRGG